MTDTGKIVQVIGPVVDIRFSPDHLPAIRNAIHISVGDGYAMTVEVAQHIGDDIVRCIAMSSTDGLVRGLDCTDTGAPDQCTGRRRGSGPHVQRAGRTD